MGQVLGGSALPPQNTCGSERPLAQLCTSRGQLETCLVADGSELAVEEGQVAHLLARASERLAPDDDVPYSLRDVFDEIRSWSLLYVMNRALLGEDDNLTYVFAPGGGGPTNLIALGVESKRRAASSAIRAHSHIPARRFPRRAAASQQRCPDCDGSHHRVIKTVYRIDNAGKQRFLLGMLSRRGQFDPIRHTEWFRQLPAVWHVRGAEQEVRVSRNSVLGSVAWDDAPLANALEPAGDVRAYRLHAAPGRWLANSYADAHHDRRVLASG